MKGGWGVYHILLPFGYLKKNFSGLRNHLIPRRIGGMLGVSHLGNARMMDHLNRSAERKAAIAFKGCCEYW